MVAAARGSGEAWLVAHLPRGMMFTAAHGPPLSGSGHVVPRVPCPLNDFFPPFHHETKLILTTSLTFTQRLLLVGVQHDLRTLVWRDGGL